MNQHQPVMTTVKSPWESKTIWVNGLSLVVAILVWVADANNASLLPFSLEPELVVTLLAIANIVLRFVTTQPITGGSQP